MSILEQLAHIRRAQGYDPLPNPHRIEGFDNGVPPPPLTMGELVARTTPMIGNQADPGPISNQSDPGPISNQAWPNLSDEAIQASPLLTLGTAANPPFTEPLRIAGEWKPTPTVPAALPGVWVNDQVATAEGNHVDLSPEDQQAIKRIILEAVHRRIKAQLDQVRKVAPRRVSKKAAKPPTATVVESVKRKRGRPRKVLPTTS